PARGRQEGRRRFTALARGGRSGGRRKGYGPGRSGRGARATGRDFSDPEPCRRAAVLRGPDHRRDREGSRRFPGHGQAQVAGRKGLALSRARGSARVSEDRAERLEILLQEILERPEAERGAYLELACGDDLSLHREVEALAAASER